jgi:hypothetical protein
VKENAVMTQMHTLRYNAMVLLFLCVPSVLFSQHSQTPLIELDKPVKWAHEKESVVRQAVGTKHVYFLLPSSLELVIEDHGVPAFSLTHYGITCRDDHGVGATLTASVRPIFGSGSALGSGSVDDLKTALLAYDPKATVIVPVPLGVVWDVILSSLFGTGSFQDVQGDAGNSLTAARPFQANLTNIGARAFVLGSEHPEMDLVGARLTYRLKGKIAHHSMPVEREFSVGMIFSLDCVKYPTAFKDLTLGGTGCLVRQTDPKPWWFGGTSCGTTDHPPRGPE